MHYPVMEGPRLKLTVAAASVVVYLSSLPLPALMFKNHEPVLGFDVLFLGWMGIFNYDFQWIANVLFSIAVVMLLRNRAVSALRWSTAAIALGLTSYLVDQWWFTEASGTPIEELGPAFYVWIASFAIVCSYSALLLSLRKDYEPT